MSELYIALGNPVKAEALLDSALLFGPPCSKIEIDKIHYYIEKIRGNQEKAYYYLEQAYGTVSDTSSLRSVEQLAALDTRQISHVLESKPDAPHNLFELQGPRQFLLLGLLALVLALAIVSFMAWRLQRRANIALKRKYQLIEQDRHSTQHEAQNQEIAEDQDGLTKSEAVEWLATLESATLAHIADNSFTLDGLSDTLGLSRRQVQRRLKAATGLTATAYLHETRLQQARLLLESGQVTSVKNLAAAIGMRDVKYFSQEFKKRFGKSPSKFTEQME
ncbi:MAG: helix-turn-helix transcriptional regulator [Lewinellaceae bacterium]|nr:helix-turn-helix transcriptional regulator [Lewinellaceae bacterium]